MNVTADATLPGALGSFGYDDEGTPAQPVDIVQRRRLGRRAERARLGGAGRDGRSGGAVRADGYNRMPMVRMTNVGPAARRPIAGVDDRRHRRRDPHGHEPVVVDRRQAPELPVRLRDRLGDQGRQLGRLLQEPDLHRRSARGSGARSTCSAGRDEWIFWGTPNCGKGEPMQIGHTGHPAVPARFRGVRVGVRDDDRARAPAVRQTSAEPMAVAERVLALVKARAAGAEAEVTVRSRDGGADPVRQRLHPPERRRGAGPHRAARRPGRARRECLARRAGRTTRRSAGWSTARSRPPGCGPPDPDWPGLAPRRRGARRRPLGRCHGGGRPGRPGPRSSPAFVGGRRRAETAGACATERRPRRVREQRPARR